MRMPWGRLLAWHCDMAERGGQERATTKGREECQAEGFGLDAVDFGSPREEVICGILPSSRLCWRRMEAKVIQEH